MYLPTAREILADYRVACGGYERASERIGLTPENYRKFEAGTDIPERVLERVISGFDYFGNIFRRLEDFGLIDFLDAFRGHSYTVRVLAKETGGDTRTARWKVRRSEELGLVEQCSETRLRLSEEGKRLLRVYNFLRNARRA